MYQGLPALRLEIAQAGGWKEDDVSWEMLMRRIAWHTQHPVAGQTQREWLCADPERRWLKKSGTRQRRISELPSEVLAEALPPPDEPATTKQPSKRKAGRGVNVETPEQIAESVATLTAVEATSPLPFMLSPSCLRGKPPPLTAPNPPTPPPAPPPNPLARDAAPGSSGLHQTRTPPCACAPPPGATQCSTTLLPQRSRSGPQC